MPLYKYNCPECDIGTDIVKSMTNSGRVEICKECETVLDRIITVPGIHGTRDGFGIKNSFRDPETGKEIETWKDWEKAGYKPLKDATPTKRRKKCSEKIKEKQDKLKHKKMIQV